MAVSEGQGDRRGHGAHLSMILKGRVGGGRKVRWIVAVPFEFVGQITGSCPMAKASDIESRTTSA